MPEAIDIDELVKRCNDARDAWAVLDGVADLADAHRKMVRSEIKNQLRGEMSNAAATDEAEGRAEYQGARARAIEARTLANITRAEFQGYELRFECWRTKNATRRAEMKIL